VNEITKRERRVFCDALVIGTPRYGPEVRDSGHSGCLFLDQNGKQLNRTNGLIPEETFVPAVHKAMNSKGSPAPDPGQIAVPIAALTNRISCKKSAGSRVVITMS
jgi:hypothetical protein